MNKSSFNSQKMENPAQISDCPAHAASHVRPDFGLGKDPSSRLAELQMVLKQPYARYRQLPDKIHGVNWLFSIEASLDQFCAVGTAQTKKEAKRRASTALLQEMGYEVPEKDLLDVAPGPGDRSLQNLPQNTAPSASRKDKTSCVPSVHIGPDFGLGKDPSSRLSELQMLRREKYAVYRTLEEKMVNNNCLFTIQASLNQFTGTGTAFIKKEAKRKASTALLLNMGFIVPEEDLPMENVLQKQVTPPGQAAVLEEAAERSSREEQCLGEISPSHERAGDLHGSDVNPHDLQTASEEPESQIDDDQSQQHGSESQRVQQTLEDTEECSSGDSRDIETAPEDITDSGDIQGPSDGATGDCPTGPETQSLEDNTKSDDFVYPGEGDVENSSEGHQSLDETKEKPPVIETPEGPGDDTDEAFTAGEPHVDPRSSEAPTDSTNDSETAVVQIQDNGTNSERAESLGETIIPLDVEIREETELPEDPTKQDGLEEELHKVTETTEPGEILPDHSVENISVTLVDSETRLKILNPEETSSTSEDLRSDWDDKLRFDGISKISQSPELWSEFPWLDSLLNTFQSLEEVPEGESVEETPDTSADSRSEGRQSPSETQSPEEREILDDDTNSESAESLVETLISQDVEIREETELPEEPSEQEGVEEVTEMTEPGEILPDRSVENISVTSGEIHNPCPKDITSDGHQILQEMLNLALASPLWTQTIEEEDEDLIDSEIPEASHTDDSVEGSSDIYDDSYQSPEEPQSPDQILDQSPDPEPATPVETTVLDGPGEEEDSAEELLTVPESTETPDTVPDRTVESFVIWVMVKKLFKHEPAHLRSYRDTLVDLLEKAALDHFVIPEGVRLKAKDVQKLGKAAARDLMYEYGGSFKVLLAAVGTKTAEFQEDAVKHLNIRLNAFKNQPKSGLKRLFSKWDKPYY